MEFVAPLARIDPIYKEEEEAFKVIQIISAISPSPFFRVDGKPKTRERNAYSHGDIHFSNPPIAKKIYCNYFCDF